MDFIQKEKVSAVGFHFINNDIFHEELNLFSLVSSIVSKCNINEQQIYDSLKTKISIGCKYHVFGTTSHAFISVE